MKARPARTRRALGRGARANGAGSTLRRARIARKGTRRPSTEGVTSAGAFPDEPARLSGEVDAIRCARADRDPFLHEPAVAWVEVLGLPGAHQLGDTLARELHDERAARGHEREELAVHLQPGGAEARAAAAHGPIPGESAHH